MRSTFSTGARPPIVFRVKWWLVAGIAVVVTGAVAIPVLTANRDASVDVVEDFFAAIEDRDASAALSLVNSKVVPSGNEAAFLEAGAIDDGWSLDSAKLKSHGFGADTVTTTFDTESGSHSTDYNVINGHLIDPFITVDFGMSPLRYAQANNLTVPLNSVSADKPAQFALFPGTYDFYAQIPDSVKMRQPKTIEVFEQEDLADSLIRPANNLSLKPSALPELQSTFDDRLAECVQSRLPKPEHCPFGTEDWITTDDGVKLSNLNGLKWELTQEPEISLSEYDPDADIQAITIKTDPRDPLTLTGTGVTRDGKSMTFTAACGIDRSTWVVTVGEHGDPALTDYGPSRESAVFDTCKEVT